MLDLPAGLAGSLFLVLFLLLGWFAAALFVIVARLQLALSGLDALKFRGLPEFPDVVPLFVGELASFCR